MGILGRKEDEIENCLHPLFNKKVYFSGKLSNEEVVKKELDKYKVEIVLKITYESHLIIIGRNQPDEDKVSLIKLQWDGYKIPIITEEEIEDVLRDWPNIDLRNRDIFFLYDSPNLKKELNITYDSLFNLNYSPIAHLDFRKDLNPLKDKEIYFPAELDKCEEIKRYLQDLGAKLNREFIPEKTDYCLLTDGIVEKLKQEKKDTFIQEIEYKYNRSSCREFRCLFLRIKELLFLLFESAKGQNKKNLKDLLKKHIENSYFLPAHVFHYTNMNALSNILRHEKLCLWATNILYLNDEKEVVEGLDIANKFADNFKPRNMKTYLKNILKKISVDQCRDYYVTSFCEKEDDLAMWLAYADDGMGCALTFNSSTISDVFNLNNTFSFVKCNYNIEETTDSFISILGLSTQRGKKNGWNKKKIDYQNAIKICLSAKDKNFRFENEWRGIRKSAGRNIKSHLKNNYHVPYIEIQIEKKALQKIIVGPRVSELSMQSIKNLLEIKGFKDVKVEKSQIPYRG